VAIIRGCQADTAAQPGLSKYEPKLLSRSIAGAIQLSECLVNQSTNSNQLSPWLEFIHRHCDARM